MKKAILILGIAAAALAVSCNKDEIKVKGDSALTGNKAYLVVNIHDAGASAATRATSPEDNNGFTNGSKDEYAVNDAHFYFYDEAGVFVSEATVWDGGNEVTDSPYNIEFKSNTVIVLNNLTGTGYPNWVVTVLNKPTDFNAPEFLEDFPATLADTDDEGIMQGTNTNFTMSTSSYYDENWTNDKHKDYYFATELVEDNFSLEPVDLDSYKAGENPYPVDIYVERLAVKVEVATSLEAADSGVTVGEYESVDLYEIEATVAGDNNEDVTDEDDLTPEIGDEKLYVGLLGWTLNATARHSNISKDIDITWTNDAASLGTGWTWNAPAYYRSYWGKSFNYGQGGADSALRTNEENPNTDSDETSEATWLSEYLKYTSLADGNLTTIGTASASDNEVEYCAENTNTAGDDGVINSKYSSAITSVLVKAIVCQKKEVDGTTTYVPADLVRYHGVLYEPEQFLNYVLNELTATGDLNAYYATEDEDGSTIYSQIDANFVKLENVADGYVAVVLDEDAVGNTTFYEKEDNGDISETEVTAETISDKLTTFCDMSEGSNYDAVGYKGGLMYYNIPIEHLRNNDEGDTDIHEANYGVVRNHYYKLTISKLENIGKGIFDPDEVIVPNPDDEELYYYVGADINILAWHVVEQNVSL